MSRLARTTNGIFAVVGIAVLADCSPSNSANTASNQPGATTIAKESPLLQWHTFTDPLTGMASKKVEKVVVLERAGQARLVAGCDERGPRTISISFSAADQTPLAVQRVETTRLITSGGSTQNYGPALDGSNTVILDILSPNGKSNPDSYGEVLDSGIPQRVEIPLSDGETPIIDFDNRNPVLVGAFKACPANRSLASHMPNINDAPMIDNGSGASDDHPK
ncbi:hypothetical protein GCM10009087_40520 [Sphingomonas oligophenolica]|uniref:Lipoprotein n=1 Tax=Sphingomonas oligophenolica TaxID=301154 RepID=A0ABU9Y219_9SPHN